MIEHNSQGGDYSGGNGPDMDAAGSAPGGDDEAAETVSIPMSAIGGQQVKPGDVIRLKVVSVDTESGAINAVYDHGDDAPAGGGSDSMAAEFDQPQTPAGDQPT